MLEGRIVKKRGHFSVNICFKCQPGEILALTGPSGAGKTTVIRAVAGLEKPDKGKITSGQTTWFDSEKNIHVPTRQREVGYVFQEHTLFPHLTVEKNIAYSCRDKEYVRNLMDAMGIRHLAKRKPHLISGGERQRTAFAQALASEPQVLLLDEPFSALDTATRNKLRRELKNLKNRLSIPVILVTHDQQEAEYLGDTIVNLSHPETWEMMCQDACPGSPSVAESYPSGCASF